MEKSLEGLRPAQTALPGDDFWKRPARVRLTTYARAYDQLLISSRPGGS